MAPLQKINVGIAPAPSPDAGQPIVRFQVRRIDATSVTRDLPATVSARGAAQAGNRTPGAALMSPTIDVPGYEFDYPVVDVPTQAEFDEAVKNNNKEEKSKEVDDTPTAKDLTPKLPQPQIIPPPQANDLLQTGTETPTLPATGLDANAAPAATATTGAEVTLPFIGTVPLPSKEALTLASTTAVTATFVAVVGKAALEYSLEGLRPLSRIAMIRLKKMIGRDLSHQEVQLDFAHQLDKKGVKHSLVGDAVDYVRKHLLRDIMSKF